MSRKRGERDHDLVFRARRVQTQTPRARELKLKMPARDLAGHDRVEVGNPSLEAEEVPPRSTAGGRSRGGWIRRGADGMGRRPSAC